MTDYGNMKVKLDNAKTFPLLVELVDESGKILASAYTEKEPFVTFDLIDAATYIIRIIFDANKNKIWDEGNYLLKRQPEKVFYFPTSVIVRSNWDIDQTVDLNGL
jgi:hypothetical protein